MRKVVAFDADGTIVDSLSLHMDAWSEAFKTFGITLHPRVLKSQFGRRADFFVRHFVEDADDEFVRRVVEEKRGIYRERIEGVRLFHGTKELFKTLRNMGVRVGIATSASRWELDSYVDRFELRALIDAAVAGNEIARSKPDPEILYKIFEKLEVDPSEAAYVGDSPHDMEAANACGALPVGVLTGGYGREVLERAGAARIFESIRDIDVSYLIEG